MKNINILYGIVFILSSIISLSMILSNNYFLSLIGIGVMWKVDSEIEKEKQKWKDV